MADEQAAVSSPAIATPAVPAEPTVVDNKDFTPTQRREWREQGKYPQPKDAATTETPAAEQAETAPDSEPGKQQEQQQQKPKFERRKEQLSNEINELLRKRAVLRGEVHQLESKPANQQQATPAATQNGELKKPKLSDFETYEQYDEAKDAYYEQLSERKAKAAIENDRREQAERAQREQAAQRQQEVAQNWDTRVKEFRKAHSDVTPDDFQAALDALVESQAIPEGSFVDHWLVRSEHGPALVYHFAKNPEELLQFSDMDMLAASRELIALEARLSGNAQPAAQPAATPAKPKPQPLPKPPVELPGRATPPKDAMQEALERGDTSTYRRLKNEQEARELAARR